MVATFVTMYKRTKLHEVRKRRKKKEKEKERKRKRKRKRKVKISEFAYNQYKRN